MPKDLQVRSPVCLPPPRRRRPSSRATTRSWCAAATTRHLCQPAKKAPDRSPTSIMSLGRHLGVSRPLRPQRLAAAVGVARPRRRPLRHVPGWHVPRHHLATGVTSSHSNLSALVCRWKGATLIATARPLRRASLNADLPSNGTARRRRSATGPCRRGEGRVSRPPLPCQNGPSPRRRSATVPTRTRASTCTPTTRTSPSTCASARSSPARVLFVPGKSLLFVLRRHRRLPNDAVQVNTFNSFFTGARGPSSLFFNFGDVYCYGARPHRDSQGSGLTRNTAPGAEHPVSGRRLS
jgi:hypothetical protein